MGNKLRISALWWVLGAVALVSAGACSPTSSQSNEVAEEDSLFCDFVTSTFDEQNRELREGRSVWADSSTKNLGFYSNCPLKVVVFKKQIMANESEMRSGWKDRKQQQWNASYCGEETWVWRDAIYRGWKVQTEVVFLDGPKHTIEAHCR